MDFGRLRLVSSCCGSVGSWYYEMEVGYVLVDWCGCCKIRVVGMCRIMYGVVGSVVLVVAYWGRNIRA